MGGWNKREKGKGMNPKVLFSVVLVAVAMTGVGITWVMSAEKVSGKLIANVCWNSRSGKK